MGAEKPPPENIGDPLGWRGPPGLVRILLFIGNAPLAADFFAAQKR